jgi:hypothetical protein
MMSAMPPEMVLNPRTRITATRHEGSIVSMYVAAPLRGRGLRSSVVSRAEEPEVVAILERIAFGGAGDLDPSAAAAERLAEMGLIIPSDEVARPVRFRCSPLDPPRDLMPARAISAVPGRLVVSPTLRRGDDALPPIPPRAWTSPFEQGQSWARIDPPDAATPSWYSLSEEERALLGRAPAEIPEAQRAALVAADLLVDPDEIAHRASAWAHTRAEAARRLHVDRWTTLSGLVSSTMLAALRRYYRELLAEGHVGLGDAQVGRRYGSHSEPLACVVHHQLNGLVSELAGEPLMPSYAYFVSYLPGAVLEPHRDRAQCAVSVSLLLDYTPEPGDRSPWPLHVEPPHAGAPTAVSLALGEGIVYRGCEVRHWRDALPAGHTSTSLLLHYVPVGFTGNLD